MRASAVAGIIIANSRDSLLGKLTSIRSMAAVPFGTHYRIVDFALSNLVNAGITNVGIMHSDTMTRQYNFVSDAASVISKLPEKTYVNNFYIANDSDVFDVEFSIDSVIKSHMKIDFDSFTKLYNVKHSDEESEETTSDENDTIEDNTENIN